MQLKSFSAVLLALITLLVSPFVLAHSGGSHVVGLSDGFMHPVTGLDHLFIAIAAGFWAARSGDHGVPDVVYFLSMLLAGMLLGICCIQFPELQLSTVIVVGLMAMFIALSIATPHYFAYIFFGGFAIYHGMVHMLEMPAPAAATGYMVGLFLATGLMCMLGLILRQVVITRKPHSHRTH
jgi:urease accessory protein